MTVLSYVRLSILAVNNGIQNCVVVTWCDVSKVLQIWSK